MSLHPSDTEALGIDRNGPFLRAAYLVMKQGKASLEKLFLLKPDEDDKKFKELLNSKLTVTALPTSKILTRRLVIKLTKDKDVEAAFPFQAEPLLPFPLSEALLDKITVSKTDDSTILTLQAAKRDHVKEALAQWDIEPEVVSSVPAALAAFLHTCGDPETPTFAVHIDCTNTTCALIKEGKLLSAYGAEMGTEALLEAYAQDLKQPKETLRPAFQTLDFSQPGTPALTEAVQKLGQEINRMIFGLKKDTKIKEEIMLMPLGEGGALKNLAHNILSGLEMTIMLPQPNLQATIEDLQRFAVPIGLGLSALPNYPDPINFRQDELAYPTPWKRFTKPLAMYAAVCLLFAFTFYIFGQSYLNYRLDQAKSEYMNMLSLLHKPYKTFEAEYEAKNKIERPADDSVLAIESFNKDDLQRRIEFLEKQIQAMPDTFALYPNVPLVSDVLAWLSNHPKVVCAKSDEENMDPACNALQLENFTYTLTKRPEQTKKTEKYQVKVDLEFSSPTPKMAREFHDALIAPNDLVDSKAEVKWSSNRGKYRASFYLKDRTPLPVKKENI